MNVVEILIVKKLVNGIRYSVTNSKHRTERIRTETKVCLFAQKLHAVFFRLHHRSLHVIWIRFTNDFDSRYLQFHCLTSTLRGNKSSCQSYRCGRGNFLQKRFVKLLKIDHCLQGMYGRTVIDLNESIASKSTNPSFYTIVLTNFWLFKNLCNFCTLHVRLEYVQK